MLKGFFYSIVHVFLGDGSFFRFATYKIVASLSKK